MQLYASFVGDLRARRFFKCILVHYLETIFPQKIHKQQQTHYNPTPPRSFVCVPSRVQIKVNRGVSIEV